MKPLDASLSLFFVRPSVRPSVRPFGFSLTHSLQVTTLLHSWRRKKFLGAWNSWLHDMERQRRAEQEAAMVEVQRAARGFVARRFVCHIHENKAAVRMQANARGFLGRRRAHALGEADRQDRAARLIQHQYRGYAGKLLGQQMMQAQREHKAASMIQVLRCALLCWTGLGCAAPRCAEAKSVVFLL